MHANHEADIVVNNLKKFYSKYNKIIFLFVISFITISIVTFTYQYFHNRYETQASENFYTLLKIEDNYEKINKAKKFVVEYKSSPYASLTQLLLISDDLKKGNWQGVDMQVQRLIQNGAPVFVLDQAYLLQARRFLSTNQEDKALLILKKIKNPNQVTVYLITGLAEKKLRNYDNAEEAFIKASTLLSRTNPESSLKNFIWYQQSIS
ncbi:MAG: tetratricopeptide repeat protein [Gammaproteobacteria bacterium]|nr:tetratricopeptide repeat protein [Gammaproteobacteria bacterium]